VRDPVFEKEAWNFVRAMAREQPRRALRIRFYSGKSPFSGGRDRLRGAEIKGKG